VAYHESFAGISFAQSGAQGHSIRNYLQLVLQSSIYPFFEILTDPKYGIFVDAVYWESVRKLPVVPFESLTAHMVKQCNELSRTLVEGAPSSVLDAVDRFVFQVYGLSQLDIDAILDTVATSLPSSGAKACALRAPREAERASFSRVLRETLQEILEASDLSVEVCERNDLDLAPWRFLEIVIGTRGCDTAKRTALPLRQVLETADADGVSLMVVHPTRSVALVGMLDRYGLWTKTRARLLANDLLETWNDGWQA